MQQNSDNKWHANFINYKKFRLSLLLFLFFCRFFIVSISIFEYRLLRCDTFLNLEIVDAKGMLKITKTKLYFIRLVIIFSANISSFAVFRLSFFFNSDTLVIPRRNNNCNHFRWNRNKNAIAHKENKRPLYAKLLCLVSFLLFVWFAYHFLQREFRKKIFICRNRATFFVSFSWTRKRHSSSDIQTWWNARKLKATKSFQ